MHSQKHMQNPKKGATRLRTADVLKAQGVGLAIGAMFFFLTDNSLLLSVLVGIAWAAGVLASDWQWRKIKALEAEIASFPAEEFVQGMNEFGVETILKKTNPFGQSAEIKLRFPGTVLQRHLTEAILEGYKDGLSSCGRKLDARERMMKRDRAEILAAKWIAEILAAKWIEEMSQGRR